MKGYLINQQENKYINRPVFTFHAENLEDATLRMKKWANNRKYQSFHNPKAFTVKEVNQDFDFIKILHNEWIDETNY